MGSLWAGPTSLGTPRRHVKAGEVARHRLEIVAVFEADDVLVAQEREEKADA